jgi:arylsulfatase A-like enzyme
MKRIIVGLAFFISASFLIAFAFAGLDTVFTALVGRKSLGGFSGHADFLVRSTVLDWPLIILAAVFFWLVSLGYSAVRRENLGFTDLRWAFTFGPAVCFLLFVLVAYPLNVYLSQGFFAPVNLFVNFVLVVVFGGVSVLSVIVGRRVAAFFKKRPAKTTAVFAGIALFILTGIWLIPASWPVYRAGKGPADGPNVIIITIDALRQDRVGAYGAGYVETPNIDRFASKAFRFEEACTPSPWTIPSMFSMISSRYPSVHGADRSAIGNPEIATIAEILSDRGYRTEAYIANPIMFDKLGFDRGFDRYTLRSVLPFRSFNKVRLCRIYRAVYAIASGYLGFSRTGSTEWLTDYLVRFLEREHDRPFFLWGHYLDPHTPLYPPREYIKLTEGDIDEAIYFERYRTRRNRELTEEDGDKVVPLYDAEVRYVDDMFGRVLDALKRGGYFEDSIIVVTADHGEELFEHGGYGHGRTHYDEVVSIPLMIYVPGAEPGVTDYPASLIDIMPTVLDCVGTEPPPDTSGESLMPVIEGARIKSGDKLVFIDRTSHNYNLKSARSFPYTLIRDGAGEYTYVLVDNTVREGPYDVIANPDPEVFERLKESVDEWAESVEKEADALGNPREIVPDEAHLEALKKLGYVD